jgi:hypothetical protein
VGVTNPSESRWLLLIHQIPPQPNYLRVKVRRRLQQLGAVSIKQTVYALPKSAQAQEDFEWLRGEIVAGGGEAFICSAAFLGGVTDTEVERLFADAREQDYLAIAEKARALQEAVGSGGSDDAVIGQLRKLQRHLADIAAIDFFGGPARLRVESLLSELDGLATRAGSSGVRSAKADPAENAGDYQGRIWVTREDVFVDRMASAWLIKRFVDPEARFAFVPGRQHQPGAGEVRFDMFEAEFTHEGERCTFETLLHRFGVGDRGTEAVAEIVHDLDFKDTKFGRPEAAGVLALLTSIAKASGDDEARLERSRELFEGLYAYFTALGASHSRERTSAPGARKAVRS